MQSMKLTRALGKLAVVSLAVCFAAPAIAQDLRLYQGTLQLGFGDPNNQTLTGSTPPADLANNGVPACANANPFIPATIATLPVGGFVDQGTGSVPRSLMFAGYAPVDWVAQSGGGQAPVLDSTCIVQFPPWLANNALRSRVQFGDQIWPGNAYNAAGTLATGAPGGTLSAGGGIDVPGTYNQTFYGTNGGQVRLTNGPAAFGGGVPVNGNGDVQLGVNLVNTNGQTPPGPLSTFGVQDYANAFLPTGPSGYGTGLKTGPNPTGYQAGNEYTWVVRTPGPMGAASTIPLTANLGWSQGITQQIQVGPSTFLPLTTMGDFEGIFHKWTTGMVEHTDMSGNYTTVRAATGHDWTAADFAANSTSTNTNFGTTRKLQLVTPWSASILKTGTGPFAANLTGLPDFGFGGLAILTLDIAPVPEPGTLSMLAFGASGLIGLGAIRRRNR